MSVSGERRKKELLVGGLALLAVALMGLFGWLMGVWQPLSSHHAYHVLYDFAGGVEVGSPVRVSGVKVGRVERIEFLPPGKEAALRLTVQVASRAAPSVRKDSRFYINMAGIIGERYVEISPGTAASERLAPGAVVRGEDPPRIDQLLSQGYGVFGRVQEFLERNEGTISEFLTELKGLMTDANQFLKRRDRQKLFTLLDNLVLITDDVRGFTQSLKDEKSRKFFDQLLDVMARLHDVDKEALRKLLQEEGIRARIF